MTRWILASFLKERLVNPSCRFAILSMSLLLTGCAAPLYPDSSAHDPEGLGAQRAAAHAIERAEEAGRSLETRDEWGATALYRASGTGGSYKAIQRLLAAGANIEGRSFDEEVTPLFAAAGASINHAHGSIQPPFEVHERVRVLLEAGADPNARNTRGETVLMSMAQPYQRGDPERVAMLLKYGADVTARDNLGKTPLMHSTRAGRLAEVLLTVPQDLEARDNTGRTALSWAAVESSTYETEPLHLLLEKGAQIESVDDQGMTPLMHAFESGWASNAIKLLHRGARPDRGGWTPLMIAAWDNDVFGVRRLIDSGVNVNERDSKGRTALHWAAKGQTHSEVFRSLCDAGADPNAKDGTGETPLHVAASSGWNGHIERLLSCGATVDARDHLGRTPLMFACESDWRFYSAKDLIEQGADVNAQDVDGVTPLMRTSFRSERTLTLLLSKGARIDLRDANGRSALDLAKAKYPLASDLHRRLSPPPSWINLRE